MENIALIGCSKTKLDHPAPARELYQGQMFRLSLRYAEEVLKVNQWFILSTQYELVHPHQHPAPYDQTLVAMKAPQRRAWAKRVLSQLQARGLNRQDVRWYILAGRDYWWFLLPDLQGEVTRPLAGHGGYGAIIRWLTDQVDAR